MEALKAVEELRLLHTLTIALDKCESLSSALGIVLREVCRATGGALGEAWLPSPDGSVLQLGSSWHIASERLRAFAVQSGEYEFRPGRGLPGRVWSSGRPAWVTDVRRDLNFPGESWPVGRASRRASRSPSALRKRRSPSSNSSSLTSARRTSG